MEFHETATIFPMMTGDEYQALKEDIAEHGLHESIWVYQGKIIDGRNRWNVCQELGIDMPTREWNGQGSLVAFIISMNLRRRHLTVSQRAMMAVDSLPYFEAEAKERQLSTLKQGDIFPDSPIMDYREDFGRAAEHVAKTMGVGRQYVYDAKRIAEDAPELAAQVRSGEMTIPQAKRELQRVAKQTMPMPTDKYRVFYADPPWQYSDAGIINEDVDNYGRAERHYPTMSIAELCALNIKDLADDNAVLFLWVTSPILPECFPVIKAWGFQYKASFVWDKVRHNFGHYNSVRHELLLVCTRGSCLPDSHKLIDSVQTIERSDVHSEKPAEFRQIIEHLYTNGKRIELFARSAVPGWESWGNEPVR